MPDVIAVRAYAAADAEPVQRIMALCTGELRAVYAPKPSTEIASNNRAQSWAQIVAVDHKGTAVGVAEYIARSSVLYVQGVAVAPTHRRRGVARAMLAFIAEQAAEQGLPVMQVVTIKETGNVEVFKRLGFAVIAAQKSKRFLGQKGQAVTEVTLERHVADN